MGNQRFSITPAQAVEDDRITDSQFRTLSALGVFGDKNGWCFPPLKQLAAMLHKSRQMVSRDIIALERLGYLQRQKRFNEDGSRKSNRIRVLFDTPPLSREMGGVSTPEVDTLSTPEVEGVSTPEVDVNAPVNAPINELKTDSAKPALSPSATAYFTAFNRKRWATPNQAKKWSEAEAEYGESNMVKAVEWAALKGVSNIQSILTRAKNLAKTNRKVAAPPPNGNGAGAIGGQARWK